MIRKNIAKPLGGLSDECVKVQMCCSLERYTEVIHGYSREAETIAKILICVIRQQSRLFNVYEGRNFMNMKSCIQSYHFVLHSTTSMAGTIIILSVITTDRKIFIHAT